MIQARRLRTALILDDEEERRTDMSRGLARHEVMSQEASTLAEAIRLMRSSSPDLILCDMVLCDPPGAANPALRGYLAVCYALERHPGSVVVQASTLRRWVHPGAVLANWRVQEVADIVCGFEGLRVPPGGGSGCPWKMLREVETAPPGERAGAVAVLLGLPVMEELGGCPELGPPLEMLEQAAHDGRDWERALAAVRAALFPGVDDGR